MAASPAPIEALVAELHGAAREAGHLAEALATGDDTAVAAQQDALDRRLQRLDGALAPLAAGASDAAPPPGPDEAGQGEGAAALRLHLDAVARHIAWARNSQEPAAAEAAVTGLRGLAHTLLANRPERG